MSFNPEKFAPIAKRLPSEELRVHFSHNTNASGGLSCFVFSEYKKHLTHKRGIDVLLLENGSIVVIEFNDDNEVVFDTTSLSLKELKMALDRGNSISSVCDLEITEIVRDRKHLLNLLEMVNGFERATL